MGGVCRDPGELFLGLLLDGGVADASCSSTTCESAALVDTPPPVKKEKESPSSMVSILMGFLAGGEAAAPPPAGVVRPAPLLVLFNWGLALDPSWSSSASCLSWLSVIGSIVLSSASSGAAAAAPLELLAVEAEARRVGVGVGPGRVSGILPPLDCVCCVGAIWADLLVCLGVKAWDSGARRTWLCGVSPAEDEEADRTTGLTEGSTSGLQEFLRMAMPMFCSGMSERPRRLSWEKSFLKIAGTVCEEEADPRVDEEFCVCCEAPIPGGGRISTTPLAAASVTGQVEGDEATEALPPAYPMAREYLDICSASAKTKVIPRKSLLRSALAAQDISAWLSEGSSSRGTYAAGSGRGCRLAAQAQTSLTKEGDTMGTARARAFTTYIR